MVLSNEDQQTIQDALDLLASYPVEGGGTPATFDEESKHLDPRVMVRLAIEHAPTEKGRLNIAIFVRDSDAYKPVNHRLEELAKQIFFNLLFPMRAQGGRTPREQSTPPSPLQRRTQVAGDRPPSLRQQATAFVAKLIAGFKEDAVHITDQEIQGIGKLECAHIIPHSLGCASETEAEEEDKLRAWNLLASFTGKSMLDFLPGHDVDSLKNVIAMESNHHYWFGKMDLWFTEPVGQEDSRIYIVHHWHLKTEMSRFRILNGAAFSGERVNFNSLDPVSYPDIDPFLLRIHAALAQVLHLSGAAEAIDKIMRDRDQVAVLSRDGSDAELLYARLSLIQAF